MNLIFDVASLRALGAQKFAASRKIVKKRTNLDLRSGGFTAVADHFNLAAVDDNFSSCDGARLARCQTKSRDTGDAWQSFTAKSECRHRLKISSRANLAGGVSLQRKQRIVAVHSAPVINYANKRN